MLGALCYWIALMATHCLHTLKPITWCSLNHVGLCTWHSSLGTAAAEQE